MMKKIFALGLCVYACSGFAQVHSFWKETPAVPAASGMISIAVDTVTDHLYTGTISDGIYKSDNNGSTWTKLLNTDTAIVKILVASQGKMYAIGGNTVFSTVNNGLTWMCATVPTQYALTDIEMLSNSALIVSTAEVVEVSKDVYDFKGDGVFMSNDGGVTWVQKSLGINYRKAITHLAVTSDDMIYAAMASYDGLGGGIYYSENLAASWTRVPSIKFNNAQAYEVANIYVITCLETDRYDSVYMAFDGSGGNYQMSGGLKSTTDDIVFGSPWIPERISRSGYNWQYRPFNSIHFAKNGRHVYSSFNAIITSSLGGPYFKNSRGGNWEQIQGGIEPDCYLTTFFAETSGGRIYAIQNGDHKMYYTDTSAIMPTATGNAEPGSTFSMYPNPAGSKVVIQATDGDKIESIAILNLNGEVCMRTGNESKAECEISLLSLRTGLYIIQVTTNSGVATRKLIVH